MIKVKFHSNPDDFLLKLKPEQLEKISRVEAPAFETNKPDLEKIIQDCQPFRQYKNFIFIGNGGSRTSAYAFYQALSDFIDDVNIELLSSAEPELIKRLKKHYHPKSTLVVITSKSGDNINAIEPILNFLGYPVLTVTGENDSVLAQIAKAKKWPIILHPNVGGRYAGMTTCGLMPACLMGLNIKEIYAGAQVGYEKYNNRVPVEKNEALRLAAYLSHLEDQGFVEIFASIYSTSLFAFLPLIIQLIHESTGKDGKGQTVFGDYSPESQHHTNQRFFGGRKNVAGLFLSVEKSDDFVMRIEKNLANIDFGGYPLGKLDGLLASETMKYDLQGVIANCLDKNIPAVEVTVESVSPRSMGQFMVFWHYFAMYSALLRDQNPFNQPAVEDSKLLSLRLRMER